MITSWCFFPPSWVPDLCCGRRVFPILHIDSNNFSDLPLGFVYICISAYGGYDHHLIMRKIIIILSLIHSENVLEKAARNAQEQSTRQDTTVVADYVADYVQKYLTVHEGWLALSGRVRNCSFWH